MGKYKHLEIITETNPSNPLDGTSYVLVNSEIDKMWIMRGINWILESGNWSEENQWALDGSWNFFNELC